MEQKIEERPDLLKKLFTFAESYNLHYISAWEADKGAICEIDSYVSGMYIVRGEVRDAMKDIFYNIYKYFVSAYSSMELHCQNLDESDMDSTLCGMVRDYFHF